MIEVCYVLVHRGSSGDADICAARSFAGAVLRLAFPPFDPLAAHVLALVQCLTICIKQNTWFLSSKGGHASIDSGTGDESSVFPACDQGKRQEADHMCSKGYHQRQYPGPRY
jgi:hypothetical protein